MQVLYFFSFKFKSLGKMPNLENQKIDKKNTSAKIHHEKRKNKYFKNKEKYIFDSYLIYLSDYFFLKQIFWRVLIWFYLDLNKSSNA